MCGWVDAYRNHGGVLFVDLRDHSGILQLVSNPGDAAEEVAKRLRNEYCVHVEGVMRARSNPNPRIPTGEVELLAEKVRRRGSSPKRPVVFYSIA